MIKKYRNISAFLVISVFLLVPFIVVKTMGGDYEMFPAAIFPGGANKKYIGAEIEVASMDIYGRNKVTNEFEELNKRSFLKKIYIHHMIYFIKPESLGAIAYDKNNLELNNIYTKYATPEDIEQTKEWIRNGLREQNCYDSVFLVKFKKLKIDKETRELISNKVIDERYFELY